MDALALGCKEASLAIPASTDIQLPYFGDEIKSLVEKLNAPLDADVIARGAVSNPHDVIRGEILMNIADAAGVTDDDVNREFDGQPIERGPQNWA